MNDQALALSKDRRHFLLRKLHSLSGIVPIGAFMLFHFYANSYARYGGKELWEHHAREIQQLPYLIVLEIGLLWLPILFHGLYGLLVLKDMHPNALRYGYGRNWMYVLQRVTGVVVFAFLILHVWKTRLNYYFTGQPADWEYMTHYLGSNAVFAFYLVGVLSAVFHFANGVWNFLVSWGITSGKEAQRLAGWACAAVGAALGYVGVDILFAFRV